jgi:hypothetical protein
MLPLSCEVECAKAGESSAVTLARNPDDPFDDMIFVNRTISRAKVFDDELCSAQKTLIWLAESPRGYW